MRFSNASLGVIGMRPPPLPKILSNDDCTLSVKLEFYVKYTLIVDFF